MKSHLIPEPQPIENYTRETDAFRFMALDQAASRDNKSGRDSSAREDDFRRGPEMPMRSFLRVVFAH